MTAARDDARDSDLAYCLDLIRRGDRDRYLTTLFAPAGRRPALVALYAFKHEVEKTHAVVSEPLLGQIRLQWWRESLDGIFAGTPRRHAVMTPLAAMVAAHALPRAPFDAIVDGHERDLDPQPFATVADLERYCAAVEGGVVALAMTALAGPLDAQRQALAEETGVGFGLARLLRRFAANLRSGPLPLARDLTAARGLEAEELRGIKAGDPRLPAAIADIAGIAARHLDAARGLFRHAHKGERAALLHLTLGRGLLARLRRAGYDPFDVRVAEPAPGEAWRLLAGFLAGRIALPWGGGGGS